MKLHERPGGVRTVSISIRRELVEKVERNLAAMDKHFPFLSMSAFWVDAYLEASDRLLSGVQSGGNGQDAIDDSDDLE